MFLNHKCLLFSVIIIFAIIYTSSNSFISSDQEFFPIIHAQSLPLPLPSLPSDKIGLEQQQNENITGQNLLSFEENMTNEEVIKPTQVTYPYGPPVDLGHTYIDIFDPDNKCHPDGAHAVVCDISLGEDIHVINTCYLTCIAFRSDPFVNNIFNAGATITGDDGNNFHFIWTNAGPIGKYYYDVESHCLITTPKDPNDPNSQEVCDKLSEVRVEINVRQPIINTPPNAIIDISPSNTVESDTIVTLNGSRSNDPDPGDEIINYKWEQIEGPPVDLIPPISSSQIGLSSPKVIFKSPELSTETTLVFELEVTDKSGASGIALATITVKPKGIPTANAGSDLKENERNNIFSRTTVQLDGSGFDPNGDALTYSWIPLTIGAPPLNNPTLPNPTFKVPNISEDTLYEYQLTVNDGKNNSPPDTVRVNVTATKINMVLDTEEITPEIGRIGFPGSSKYLVNVPGFTPPTLEQRTQPGIPGGEVIINLQIEGITKPSKVPVSLEFEPLEDTGGHDHLNTITEQSKRAFGGFVKQGAALVTELNGKFDSNGILISTFRAENLLSKYSSAAGFIDIKASILLLTVPFNEDVEEATVKDRVTIRIAGLSPLLEGNNYNLVGSTSAHPDNHYGNPVINIALNEIADDYESLHPRDLLRYNDQSLVFGGVFDISGDWIPEGPDGHKSHACGTDIDIGRTSVRGTDINQFDLAKIIMTKYPGAFMINEGDHFHAHFEHCR